VPHVAAQQGETAATPVFAAPSAQPPAAVKRFYRSPNGQLYVPAGTPVKLSIALTGGAASASSASGADASNESSLTLKEGPTNLDFGGINVPVIADGTPPSTTLDIGRTPHRETGGVIILGAHPTLNLTATDALSGVARTFVSLDGGAFAPLTGSGPTISAEGDHTVRFYSIDQVGNAEPVHEYLFRLDASAPATSAEWSGPHVDAVIGVGARLSLSAADAVAGVQTIQYQLDGAAEQTYEKPFQADALPEGKHRLVFHAVDRVANVEVGHTYDFLVDRQAPEIALAITGPQFQGKGARYVGATAEITLTARDTVAGATPVQYRVDDSDAEVPYTAPFHLPAVTGVHKLRLSSTDSVENRAQTLVPDLYVDVAPPSSEVEYSRPFFVRNDAVVINPTSRIALRASDPDSGVASIAYAVDDGADQTYTQPFSVAVQGDHKLRFFATDHVGNREPAQTVLLHVEPAGNGPAPESSLDAKRWYLHPKLGLLGPPGLPFELRIADSPDAASANFLIASDTKGPLTFRGAGPTKLGVAISGKTEAFGLAIDALPPATTLAATGARRFEKTGVLYFGPGLKFSLTSSDNPTGVSSGLWKILYSLDNAPFVTYAHPLTGFLREGEYTLRYSALDNVGNAEKAQMLTFTIDTSPPKTRVEWRGPKLGAAISPATYITLEPTDNLSGVARTTYRIDGGTAVSYGGPFTLSSLSEGPHTLRYFSEDAVGNREEEHVWKFTLKSRVAPAVCSLDGTSYSHAGTIFVLPGTRIRLRSSEGNAVVYTLDGAQPATYAVPILIPDTGNHRLSFHAVDELDNVSTTQTLNLATERTPPNSHIHFEGEQLSRDSVPLINGTTRIVLDANAGAIGGSTLEYSVGGGFQPYHGPFTLKNSGSFEISWRARDPLNNLEPVQRQHVFVDAQGPVINITYTRPPDAGPAVVLLQPGSLILVAADDPTGLKKITYKIDDQPELIYRTPLSGFVPGRVYTVSIVAEDLLGNRSQKTMRVRMKEATR
jgi:hypothetical protein